MSEVKESQSFLDRLYMAAPCKVGWDNMKGNDRVRFCGTCSKNVYNISDMTSREAESFLQSNGTSVCMRFYQRADGTIINDDCPVGLRKLRDSARAIRRFAASIAGFCLSISNAVAQGGKWQDINLPTTPVQIHAAVFDGRPGIRHIETLPPVETLTSGHRALKLDEEIAICDNQLVITTSAMSAKPGNREHSLAVSYDVLPARLSADSALQRAQQYEAAGNFLAANSYYKLVLKYFEAFDVYDRAEQEQAVEKYAQFLEHRNKAVEAEAVRKDMSEEFERPKVPTPPRPMSSGRQFKITPTLAPGTPIPDNE